MAIIYYPVSSSTYTRRVSGGQMVEQYIDVAPDQIIVLSGSTPGNAVDFITASYALSYLFSSSYTDATGTASFAYTSSIALTTPSASYAASTSVLSTPVSVYGSVSASFNPTTSLSQGSLILWINPDSSSYFDSGGSFKVTTHGQTIKYFHDISGLNRDCYMHVGTAASQIQKYSIVYNTGPNNNKTAIWSDYSTTAGAYSSTFTTPTYPLWAFFVGKINYPILSSQVGIFDGVGASNRVGIWVGTNPQIYAGANFTGLTITGSHGNWITGSGGGWFLQSFKNTGGAGCYARTNGTHSLVPGNAGAQSLTGYSFGTDYALNGGGTYILEFMVFSNITDADAFNIENWLMARHEIPHIVL